MRRGARASLEPREARKRRRVLARRDGNAWRSIDSASRRYDRLGTPRSSSADSFYVAAGSRAATAAEQRFDVADGKLETPTPIDATPGFDATRLISTNPETSAVIGVRVDHR